MLQLLIISHKTTIAANSSNMLIGIMYLVCVMQ